MKKWLLAVGIAVMTLGGLFFSLFGVTSVKNAASFSKVLSEQSIEVKFSNPINMKSVKQGDIIVRDESGNQIPIKYSVSDDGKTLMIRPTEEGNSLQEGNYVLELSKAITSRWGIPIWGEKEFAFSVIINLPTIETEEELRNILLSGYEEAFNEAPLAREEKATSDTSLSVRDEFSQTNVQVAGIDEGDLVKTDGEYIYSTNNQEIFITSAAEMKVISTISFEEGFYPQELFLRNDKLVAISEVHNHVSFAKDLADMRIISNGQTKIKVFDVSNKAKPVQVKEVGIEGSFRASRMSDSFVYIVASQYPDMWILRDLEKENEGGVPYIFDENGMQKQALDKIQYVPGSTEKNFLHLMAIDLDSLDYNVETILGSGENIYMSSDHLYVAASNFEMESDSSITRLFKFNVDGLKMTFNSMGEVNGRIINQFAMDEHEGNFRIATTIYKGRESTNSLYILNQKMQLIGELNNLAKDERIYSVRYMGDKAYMVTFKEVDPLFVIDTSVPTKPKVLGELKIPGYSSYLHFYDEEHLIGFGYDTEAVQLQNGEPFVRNMGMKISLFDVSDFYNPKEKDSVIIGGRGTHSEVLYDHKSLFQHRDKHLYGFPISIYESKGQFDQQFVLNGALIYEITPEKGIVLKTTIKNSGDKEEYVDWEEMIRRLMYIDDNLYTISNKQIKSYYLDDFSYQNKVELPMRK